MKTIARILMIGAGVLSLSFCSLFKAGKPAPSRGFLLPLEEEARLDVDGEIIGGLQAHDGKIYFSTSKGSVGAIDGGTKKILWNAAMKLPAVTAPAIGSDRLVFSDRDNGFHCLSLDGKTLWTKTIQAKLTGEIALVSGRAVAITDESDLLALDLADGAEAWRFKAGGAIRTPLGIWNLQLVFGTAEGKLYVLTPQGQVRTTYETGSIVMGPLSIDKNRIYYGLADGTFRCFDLAVVNPLWKVRTGGFPMSRPVADDQRIYVVISNDVLFCFDKRNGNLAWWRMLSGPSPFAPFVGQEQIFAATLSSVLTVYKKKGGEYAGGYDAADGLRSGPLRVADYIVIHSYNRETDKGKVIFLKGSPPPPAPVKKK